MPSSKKTNAIMIQGTGSGVGKSLLTAALARYFFNKGIRVAPFKAQNMALNSFVTPDGCEMGRAQVYQAEACGLEPDVRMNPILLKPNADNGSQVILLGRAKGNLEAREYYEAFPEHWKVARDAYDSLARDHDLLLLEGAGSPAEINLRETDLVNMRMAEHAGAKVLIVGDIDRGGVFAWMKGTYDLLAEAHKDLVKGFIINKFRGDQTLLTPGIRMFENMVGRPVLGVVPHRRDTWIDEEDSLALEGKARGKGGSDVAIGVVRLPRISNFTDFVPLSLEQDVSLSFLQDPSEVAAYDCVILPGSKATLADARRLSKDGWFDAIRDFKNRGKMVVGICGGYQMLGERIADPRGVEGDPGETPGLGFLPLDTEMEEEKILRRVVYPLLPQGIFSKDRRIEVKGYEIHMGRTRIRGAVERLFESDDPTIGVVSADDSVFGTYLHGLFDSDSFRRAFINVLRKQKGLGPLATGLAYREFREVQLDKLAELVEAHLDMDAIGSWVV